MKMKSILVFGAMALAVGQASAATRVFNITGATAFRASANNAIISILGGAGVTEYAYTGTQGVGGTNRAIFVGTMAAFPGDEVIVRASWSGSTGGITAVEDNAPVQVLDVASPVSTSGINLGEGADPAPVFTTAVAQWSFSDVDKLLSPRPNATFNGGTTAVGVVPFMFLAGEGAPASLNNMTDQLHAALWKLGTLPMSTFNGDTLDATTVIATGRAATSGTRATILSETAYGSATTVTQFNATFTGTRTDAYPTGRLLAVSEFGNGGHGSNSGVRELLTRRSDDLTFGGDPFDGVFVSYLTISDALSAISEGAQEMTYNGEAFSADNVKKGSYTLWGYQQFYLDADYTADELIFDTAFRAAIPSTLDGVSAIAIPDMLVTRAGGDGGPVQPNQ